MIIYNYRKIYVVINLLILFHSIINNDYKQDTL